MTIIIRNENAKRTAISLLQERYPKVTKNLDIGSIDVDEDNGNITVWHENGDRDFFNAKGEYIGSKQY